MKNQKHHKEFHWNSITQFAKIINKKLNENGKYTNTGQKMVILKWSVRFTCPWEASTPEFGNYLYILYGKGNRCWLLALCHTIPSSCTEGENNMAPGGHTMPTCECTCVCVCACMSVLCVLWGMSSSRNGSVWDHTLQNVTLERER